MSTPTHLRSLQAVHLALRIGSLKGAAEQLAITPAAVGQRIKVLEDYLGVELVVRSRSGLRPAPVLAGALLHINTAFDELDRAAAALDLQKADEIHIAANLDVAELWLWPRLRKYRDIHPNTKFCINGEGDVPMRLGPADCEIRFRAAGEDETADVLFRDFLIPVTSPLNLERVRTTGTRLELFPLLHLDFYKDDPDAVSWPAWFQQHGYRETGFDRGMRFRRIAPAVGAVLSDAGVMITGLALLQDRIRDGSIVLPYPRATGCWTSFAFFARYRSSSLMRPQVRRFRDWLKSEASETRRGLDALLAGFA